MICCINCFKDTEIRAAIEMIGHIGDCPVCRNRNTWIYDSEKDADKTNVGEMLDSILELYVPESELSTLYPEDEEITKKWLADNKVKYHKLILGKPTYDVIIDDRALMPASLEFV